MNIKIFILILFISISANASTIQETIQDLSFKIGHDPEKIVSAVNLIIPANYTNCEDIADFVYRIMYSRQYSDLKRIGVVSHSGLRHRIVVFRDRWGDLYYISSPATQYQDSRTKLYKCKGDTIKDICYEIYPDPKKWYPYTISGGKGLSRMIK